MAHYGLLTTGYPHTGDTVAGSFVRAMALALVDEGHRVDVVCAARRDGPRWDTPLRDDGVRVWPARYAIGETYYGRGAPDALLAGQVAQRVRALVGSIDSVRALSMHARRHLAHVDVLVSHFALPCGAIGAAMHAHHHVLVSHGTDAWLAAKLPRSMRARMLRGADAVWCSHDGVRRALDVPGAVRWVVRPMGWSSTRAVASSRPAREGALCVVMVTRLVPVKGVDLALHVIAAARAKGTEVRLMVAGDGPERARLEALAEQLAPGAVTWCGAVDATMRDGLLAEAEVFLHTARALADGRTEGAPVAVLEAMGAGLAVAAFDAGGVASLVGDGGECVREGDVTALASVLVAWAGDRSALRARGEAARTRAAQWTWRETARWMATLTAR